MRIAITYTGTEEKHENYVRWVKGNDPIEVLRISAADDNLHALSECDGLLLSGGVDMHPRFYGSEMLDYPNRPASFQEERDEFEMAAFEWALRHKLPILGVCRGMQLINCVLGGTMNQDLGPLNASHKAEASLDKIHPVQVESDTLLKQISGTEESPVNSAHHQSIGKVADTLRVNARATDGTIEGLEWKDKETSSPFLLCIQWHPERMFKVGLENSVLSKNIRERFINEIRNSKKHT